MKIAFHEIVGSEIVHSVYDDGWFPHDEIETENEPQGRITIRRIDDERATLSGNLLVDAVSICDRCCQKTRIKLVADYSYHCVVGKEDAASRPEMECREEDCNILYLKEPVIELGEILREQVYLAMPERLLCYPSCKGLCLQCGTNLNQRQCSCDLSESSSPFGVLRRLKGK